MGLSERGGQLYGFDMRVKPSALTGGSLPELKERIRMYSREKEDRTLCSKSNNPVSLFFHKHFHVNQRLKGCVDDASSEVRIRIGKRRTLCTSSSNSISAISGLISSIVRKMQWRRWEMVRKTNCVQFLIARRMCVCLSAR